MKQSVRGLAQWDVIYTALLGDYTQYANSTCPKKLFSHKLNDKAGLNSCSKKEGLDYMRVETFSCRYAFNNQGSLKATFPPAMMRPLESSNHVP